MSGFGQYQQARTALLQQCDQVESIWREAMSRTEFEEIAGADEVDTSLVSQVMTEARQRLASSVVEVGVFGSIKRGKSTLINGLVGVEVSPMRVTPETAVPVWIESGLPESKVLLIDGSVVAELSLDDAQLMSTQRYKARDAAKRPLRVEHRLRIPWLPDGVRIVDTPGLDDPSLAEDYESLTLAELDRVAATVFVMVSPPGPSGEEIRLLKTLGSRSVDKLFLVCNFYPDHWNDPDVVSEMTGYIERIVAEGAGQGVDSRDVKVFAVSARDGFKAAVSGDEEALERSGVAALRRELERYLARGVLDRMLGYVERRVQMVVDLTTDTLLERQRLLSSPSAAQPARDAAQRVVMHSRAVLSEILLDIDRLVSAVLPELTAIVTGPFVNAAAAVQAGQKTSDLEVVMNRLRLQFETAASEASTIFSQRAGLEQVKLQRRLYESFGVEERLRASGGQLNLGGLGDIAPSLPRVGVDRDAIATTSAVTATIGGVSMATIAGGAGVALLAAGPIGWLIGLGIGALFGGGLGALGARMTTRDALRPEHRQQVLGELQQHEARVRNAVSRSLNDWRHGLVNELELMRSSFFAEREAELRRIESIISNETARKNELARIETLLRRLRGTPA